uniref:Uncharacterized protein n=1 Tax=Staphylococcus aureus TaxID=1280 RepID=L7PEF1_STAAU|nr:hypothetical protein SACH_a06 [Staphylococcus aureus]AYK27889.1 hypothetical protein D0Y75_a00110 [Staphylococcus aureus]AYK27968.1 hypothetical protein D0Y79_a00110 [Staphylococcus aureus]AYK27992.1 hypothetical protein D0Y81_a00115 [Staphylococcus aureus]AYK28081.1 hypothetical protein BJL68_a00115 [Staphylococcus aureus]
MLKKGMFNEPLFILFTSSPVNNGSEFTFSVLIIMLCISFRNHPKGYAIRRNLLIV